MNWKDRPFQEDTTRLQDMLDQMFVGVSRLRRVLQNASHVVADLHDRLNELPQGEELQSMEDPMSRALPGIWLVRDEPGSRRQSWVAHEGQFTGAGLATRVHLARHLDGVCAILLRTRDEGSSAVDTAEEIFRLVCQEVE